MSIDIEGKLAHLSELLGELLALTSDTFGEHAANVVGSLIVQAPGALLFEGKPATHLLYGTQPYPMDAIRMALEPCTEGDPDQALTISEGFGRARLRITEDLEASLGSINNTIDDWEGTAANDFRTYVANMIDAVSLQSYALDDAQLLTDALSQIVAGAHAGVHTLLDDSITQVEEAIKGKVIANIKTTTGGVVAGTAAAVAGNPSGLISWATNTLSEKVIDIIVNGTNEDVPRAIRDAAKGLASGVADQVTSVEEKLAGVLAAIGAGADATNLPQVQPEKPMILDPVDFNPESFGLTDDKLREGVEDDVSTEPLDAATEEE